jgi:hypothetical protein
MPSGRNGAVDHRRRRMVAAHRIDRDADHDIYDL